MSFLPVIALLIGVWLLFAAAVRPKAVLYAAVFFLPWRGLSPHFFLGVSLSRILIVILAIATIFRFTRIRDIGRVPMSRAMLVYILYAVTLSLARIPFLPEVGVFGGALRGPVNRALLQIIYFLAVLVTPLIVCPIYLKTTRDCAYLCKSFFISLIILAGLGWVQLGVWYTTGFDLFPVGLVPGFFGYFPPVRPGFVMAGLDIHRMCSLGGEPKDLGQGLVVGLLVVQAILAVGLASPDERKLRWCWLFFFFSMLMTYSTSSIFLWAVGSGLEIVILLFRPVIMGGLSRLIRNARTLIVAAALIACVIVSYSGISFDKVRRVAEGRSVDRAELEEFDEATLAFLEHDPDWTIFGTGMGNVHLYANAFLSPDAATYANQTVFRPKTGLLRMAAEIGIIGILFWLVSVFDQTRYLLKYRPLAPRRGGYPVLSRIAPTLFIVVLTLAGCQFAVDSIEEYVFASLALSLATISIISELNRNLDVNSVRAVAMDMWPVPRRRHLSV